jgi:epoxyqueuosine reductase
LSLVRHIIEETAREQRLDLAGVARVEQLGSGPDVPFLREWLAGGYHASMNYLAGRGAAIRAELGRLLPGARSVICAAVNYNTRLPYSTALPEATRAWIARYAWGDDYHAELRWRLERFVERLRERLPAFEARVSVDTSPVLERALARYAGIGWLGKNTCLINQKLGSWLFLGEVLTTLEVAPDGPTPDRCGSCTRCLEACPTGAILAPRLLDSRRCISYWTIEEKGSIDPAIREGIGRHVFGCDICQDVCPWNRKAAAGEDACFQPRPGCFNPPLEQLARITEEEFRAMFRRSAIRRAKYRGFMRNVCVAMGNSGDGHFRGELERLAAHPDPLIREHAEWALARLAPSGTEPRPREAGERGLGTP